MATKEPGNARDGRTARWSDVWCNGKNLFELVEKKLESPLPRDLEIPSKVSERSSNSFFRLMWDVDLYPSYLWRDLELIDASVCRGVTGVGPTTVLRLVEEFAEIARRGDADTDEPQIPSAEIPSELSDLVVDEVMYEIYGGSEGGFRRLRGDEWDDDETASHLIGCVLPELFASNLQESKRVVRNMLVSIEGCGHLVTTEKAVRWMWDGGELETLLREHHVPDAKVRAIGLESFEAATASLRDRLSLGMSLEEIAKARGRHKRRVKDEIVRWLHYVPEDLCAKFSGINDPRIYEYEPEAKATPIKYQHPFVPGWCLNCDGVNVSIAKPLYCSEMCQQMAGTVRYVRACRRDGRILRQDVKEAVQMRVAQTVAGGYPTKDRRTPDDVRRTVMENANGHCQKCGRTFDPNNADAIATIQHMSGSSSELSNLEAWCRRCNMADAQSRFVPIAEDSPASRALAEMKARWEAPTPLRPCDDDQRWNDVWREMAKQTNEELRHQAEVAEFASDEDLPGFRGWTPNGTPIQDF